MIPYCAVRDATRQEIEQIKRESTDLNYLVASLSLEVYRLKKTAIPPLESLNGTEYAQPSSPENHSRVLAIIRPLVNHVVEAGTDSAQRQSKQQKVKNMLCIVVPPSGLQVRQDSRGKNPGSYPVIGN